MKTSNAGRTLGLIMLGGAVVGCSETTTQSNEHHPRTYANTPSLTEPRTRAGESAHPWTEVAARFERPGPAGSPNESVSVPPPDLVTDYPPGPACECTVSAATLD